MNERRTRGIEHRVSRRDVLAGAGGLSMGALLSPSALGATTDQARNGGTVGQAGSSRNPPAEQVNQSIFFVTNRKPTGDRDLRRQFGT